MINELLSDNYPGTFNYLIWFHISPHNIHNFTIYYDKAPYCQFKQFLQEVLYTLHKEAFKAELTLFGNGLYPKSNYFHQLFRMFSGLLR